MRAQTTTQKVETAFGAAYIHVDVDGHGRPVGGSISTPRKAPDSTIAQLFGALSAGLDDCLGDDAARSVCKPPEAE